MARVVEVRRCRLSKPRRVYNLSVRRDPTYFANGILVHNCRCTTVASTKTIRRWA